jgi:hypothetical protein
MKDFTLGIDSELAAMKAAEAKAQKLVDSLDRLVSESGVGAGDAAALLLHLGIAKAVCNKLPNRTWLELKTYLIKKLDTSFDEMTAIIEKERSAA